MDLASAIALRIKKTERDDLPTTPEEASGATRFANGDWTDLPRVMPLIDKFVRRAGWAPFVMDTFLILCERAGAALGSAQLDAGFETGPGLARRR